MQSRQENIGATSTASSKLMAVDDESDITFTLKVVLEQSCFSLDVFNDPKTALSNFKPNYYDLILLDVKMPQMNGFELYQELKKKDKNIKACFVTAYELYYESLKKEFPKLNVGCFILIPINVDDLVKRIKKELFELELPIDLSKLGLIRRRSSIDDNIYRGIFSSLFFE